MLQLVGRRQLTGLLNLHGLVAAVYLAVAALGAEHAAAAFFTGITFAELVGHLAVLPGVLGDIGGFVPSCAT